MSTRRPSGHGRPRTASPSAPVVAFPRTSSRSTSRRAAASRSWSTSREHLAPASAGCGGDVFLRLPRGPQEYRSTQVVVEEAQDPGPRVLGGLVVIRETDDLLQ